MRGLELARRGRDVMIVGMSGTGVFDFGRELVLLDGAMGTELEARDVALPPPLWTAGVLLTQPKLVQDVHEAYLEAGADAITTATFRTHPRNLVEGGHPERRAVELTREAVRRARAARDVVNRDAFILGGIGPLGESYDPSAGITIDATKLEAAHRSMAELLMAEGVHALLFETMNSMQEAQAAVRAARAVAPRRWMMSFITRHDGPPGVLLSGQPLADLLPELHDALSVGVNCVPASRVEAEVRLMRRLLPDSVRIMAYANTGRMDPGGIWRDTEATDTVAYAQHAARWLEAGASVIGGCCGTRPGHVRALRGLIDGRTGGNG